VNDTPVNPSFKSKESHKGGFYENLITPKFWSKHKVSLQDRRNALLMCSNKSGSILGSILGKMTLVLSIKVPSPLKEELEGPHNDSIFVDKNKEWQIEFHT